MKPFFIHYETTFMSPGNADPQSCLVSFPNGERVPYITNTVVSQNTQQSYEGYSVLEFSCLINPANCKVLSNESASVKNGEIVSPNGNQFKVKSMKVTDYDEEGILVLTVVCDCIFLKKDQIMMPDA